MTSSWLVTYQLSSNGPPASLTRPTSKPGSVQSGLWMMRSFGVGVPFLPAAQTLRPNTQAAHELPDALSGWPASFCGSARCFTCRRCQSRFFTFTVAVSVAVSLPSLTVSVTLTRQRIVAVALTPFLPPRRTASALLHAPGPPWGDAGACPFVFIAGGGPGIVGGSGEGAGAAPSAANVHL